MNPMTPTLINCLRPRRSDIRAHFGAVMTHSKADQLNARLTQTSGISSSLAIAGSADCIAVLPAAATSMTRKQDDDATVGNGGDGAYAFFQS